MEVKNGIIIDGVLHEAMNYSSSNISCNVCSLVNELIEHFNKS